MLNPSCEFPERAEIANQYVLGTVSGAELEAWELHLLTCTGCQTLVTQGAELRAAFRQRTQRRRASMVAPLALAAAATIAFVLLSPSRLEKLGRITAPPRFVGMEVRSGGDSLTGVVTRAIDAYERGEYATAARALTGPYAQSKDPGIGFLLGMSLLLNSETDSAVVVLGRVADAEKVYADEARFYRGKAWLRLERPDSALASLRAVSVRAPPSLRTQALQLVDSLRLVR